MRTGFEEGLRIRVRFSPERSLRQALRRGRQTPFGPIFEIHTPIARNQPARYIGTTTRPKRLEHVNCHVRDTHGFRDLMVKLFGMRISDRANDDGNVWYRAWGGFHHTVAASKGNKMHHYAFDAQAVEDLVSLADALDQKGRTLLWGPGRHGAGDNIFTYYRDPNGCVVETSFGMTRVENDDAYEMRDWTKERPGRMRNRWGPATPSEYFDNGTPYLTN
jgi:catechol 2,3-dioxygenase-like lactoylglutathione lyase family enzyme